MQETTVKNEQPETAEAADPFVENGGRIKPQMALDLILTKAVKTGASGIAILALGGGARLSYKARGRTISHLHEAVFDDTLLKRMVRYAMCNGLNLDCLNDAGVTALFYAASKSTEATRILVEGGADPEFTDTLGRTPLMNAVMFGPIGCVKELLGVSPDFDDNDGRRALHLAVLRPTNPQFVSAPLDFARCLLEAGYNIDNIDKRGNTPLMLAVWNKNVEIVKMLLDYGANPHVVDKDGATPYSCAKNIWEDDNLFEQVFGKYNPKADTSTYTLDGVMEYCKKHNLIVCSPVKQE